MSDAIIIGGGPCGLGAALFCARRGHGVTVIEPDGAPPCADADADFSVWKRPGAVHGRQGHSFLARTTQVLRQEAPEVMAALLERGVREMALEGEEAHVTNLITRRFVLEAALRRAVMCERGVEIVRTRVTGLIAERGHAGPPRVAGVATELGPLHAPIVVDATGRRSNTTRWLLALRGRPPVEKREECGFHYVSRHFRLRPGREFPQVRNPIVATLPYASFLVFPADSRTFSIAITVSTADPLRHALMDPDVFPRVMAAVPIIAPWIDVGVPTDPPRVWVHARDNWRRLVDGQGPVVAGLLLLGDAAMNTSPTFGRGISLGLMHAQLLADELERALGDPEGAVARFEEATTEHLGVWFESQKVIDRGRVELMARGMRGGLPHPVTAPIEKLVVALEILSDRDAVVAAATRRVHNLLITPRQLLSDRNVLRPVLAFSRDTTALTPPMSLGPDRATFEQLVRPVRAVRVRAVRSEVMRDQPLLAWIDDPSFVRGVHFATHEAPARGAGRGSTVLDAWETWSYARLAGEARRLACGLQALAIAHDDVVLVVLPSGPQFVSVFFGALLAGATPAPLATPAAFQDIGAYTAHINGAATAARPFAVITQPDLADRIRPLVVCPVLTIGELGSHGDTPRPAPPPALGVLQFTSGTTGRARGVRIPFGALNRNLRATDRWIGSRVDDALVSWLPVHHDMGLVGGLLMPIVKGNDLYNMSPETFLQRPERWLRCLGTGSATVTVTPPFALDFVAKKVAPARLEGLDFSSVLAIILGAERVTDGAMARFLALLEPFGLQARAFKPAYGLAEATLCVTASSMAGAYARMTVAPASLNPGQRVIEQSVDQGGQIVIGCGRALTGTTVTIEDESGTILDDLQVGEIVVRGPSLAAGYLTADASAAATTRLHGEALRTGDAGFLCDGELFVLGRLGDSMKVRGRVVFAEQIEVALADLGLRPQSFAVLLGVHDGVPTAVGLLERPEPALHEPAMAIMRRHAEGARVALLDVRPGTIARTSSGKPRRSHLFAAFVANLLPARFASGTPDEAGPESSRTESESTVAESLIRQDRSFRFAK